MFPDAYFARDYWATDYWGLAAQIVAKSRSNRQLQREFKIARAEDDYDWLYAVIRAFLDREG